MNLTRLALRLVFSGSLAALVMACSMLLPARPPDVYRLPPQYTGHAQASFPAHEDLPARAAVGTPATGPVPLRLRVGTLDDALAGERIIVMPTPDTVEAYHGARWSDPAPEMVRAALMEAFARDGRFIAVTNDESTLDVTFELDTRLRAFQSEYREGKPVVHIGLDAWLINPQTRRVIATQRFDVETRPEAANIGAVVASFGDATDALSSRLLDWVAWAATPQVKRDPACQ